MKPRQLCMQGAGCPEAHENQTARRSQGRRAVSSRALHSLPTVTAVIVALASTLVLTLAGCASSAGIAPAATTIAPATVGLDTQATTPDVAADWWKAFGDARMSEL